MEAVETRQRSEADLWPAFARVARTWWFLALAAALFCAPVIVGLARTVWNTDQGGQGPLILATGLWLLSSEALDAGVHVRRHGSVVTGIVILLACAAYVLASMLGMLTFQCLAAYCALVAAFAGFVGAAAIRRLWFPLAYLLFVVPPPYALIGPTTRSLKLMISAVSVDVLSALGYQVASSGATLYIDGYEVLVAAACSGMNSILSLLAVGLFYIYLRHRADWRYAALLAVLVLPIAIFTNLVRVFVILLLTHYAGEAVAQGILHEATGMVMFFVALLALFGIDALLSPLRERLMRRRA